MVKIRAGAHPTYLTCYNPSKVNQQGNGKDDALVDDAPSPRRGSTVEFLPQATHTILRGISEFEEEQ